MIPLKCFSKNAAGEGDTLPLGTPWRAFRIRFRLQPGCVEEEEKAVRKKRTTGKEESTGTKVRTNGGERKKFQRSSSWSKEAPPGLGARRRTRKPELVESLN